MSSKILYALIASKETRVVTVNIGSTTDKYVRACKKILKKINGEELHRPDGMATLLSGKYAYNYIHGCDKDKKTLIFLCVTESLPSSSSNITPSQLRKYSYQFLQNIRNNFLQQFRGDIEILIESDNI